MATAFIAAIEPARAVEGGRVVLRGDFRSAGDVPAVTVGGISARVTAASAAHITVTIPPGVAGGRIPVSLGVPGQTVYVSIGHVWATGLHQVDSPVFDGAGRLYVTYSGPRGQASPVSIFRVTRQGTREPFASGIVNATSTAIGPDRALYVSSRFEGAVYRVAEDGTHEAVASELGIACGLAFDGAGRLYVGDRSGTVFRVHEGRATPFATVPASVAAFHLAMSPAGDLYVTAPTLSTRDRVYRIAPSGDVEAQPWRFGRPQGLAFDGDGALYVVEALAGSSGVYRVVAGGAPELAIAGPALVGVAVGPQGELAVASNDTVYRFD